MPRDHRIAALKRTIAAVKASGRSWGRVPLVRDEAAIRARLDAGEPLYVIAAAFRCNPRVVRRVRDAACSPVPINVPLIRPEL